MNINDFVKPRPCYGLEKIEAKIEANLVAIAGAREFWTALGILRLAEDIPSHYRLWAVLREPLISAKTLHLFACNVAEQALLNAENTDARSWDAISAKRLWLAHQATDEELSAACSAASDAVFAACTSAAFFSKNRGITGVSGILKKTGGLQSAIGINERRCITNNLVTN